MHKQLSKWYFFALPPPPPPQVVIHAVVFLVISYKKKDIFWKTALWKNAHFLHQYSELINLFCSFFKCLAGTFQYAVANYISIFSLKKAKQNPAKPKTVLSASRVWCLLYFSVLKKLKCLLVLIYLGLASAWKDQLVNLCGHALLVTLHWQEYLSGHSFIPAFWRK